MSAVTVSMPYFGCRETVARAVESVLAQTFTDLTLVVVNDGGPPEVWDPLAGIDDPRLVRVDLPENRGRYFADAVVLAACATPWWTVHDADDWSDPHRLDCLFAEADSAGADAVFGGYRQHRLGTDRTVDRAPALARVRAGQLRHVAHHTAIYRTGALRAVHGPHPGYRAAYDTLLVSLCVLRLRCSQVDAPLYHHCHRPGSLTLHPDTGMNSRYRRAVHRRRSLLWNRIVANLDDAGATVAGDIDPDTAGEVAEHADRLAGLL